MARHSDYCDGVSRRDFVRAGALGFGGLTLASYLRMAQAEEVAAAQSKAGILIYLSGGPTHMDTFDLKPEAPEEYRGEFRPTKTNVPGMEICEHLPEMAKVADKYAILRGVSHTLAAHALGKMYLNTGNRPIPSLVFPSYAAVVSKELPGRPELPSAVAVPDLLHSAGYLGIAHNPLVTGGTPRMGAPFTVRGTSPGGGLTVTDVDRRQQLLARLDGTFRAIENQDETLQGLDEFGEQAYQIISSRAAREAFDTSREPTAVSQRFGESGFGQSCLLAARLVGSGVRFVTINNGGWDTHQQNFTRLKERNLPELDRGVAALLTTLEERGLLETTTVMICGEFGRTPKVNARGGRDHYPRAMFVVMAGGGIRGGQVIGASDEKGTGPAGDAITPDQVAASFYHSLGIDATKEYHTSSGRPVMIVREGTPIKQLFA